MRDFGLVAVTLFGLVVAVFVAGSLLRKEIDKRTVFVLFSKPVGRSEFIVGKFLGLAQTMFVVVAGMGLFLFVTVWHVASRRPRVDTPCRLLVFVQLVVVVAITIFFSTFVSAILASVVGVCVFIAGQLSQNVLSLTRLGHSGFLKAVSWVVFVAVPNLTAVDIKAAVAGEAVSRPARWGVGRLPGRLLRRLSGAGLVSSSGARSSEPWPRAGGVGDRLRVGVVAFQASRPAASGATPTCSCRRLASSTSRRSFRSRSPTPTGSRRSSTTAST